MRATDDILRDVRWFSWKRNQAPDKRAAYSKASQATSAMDADDVEITNHLTTRTVTVRRSLRHAAYRRHRTNSKKPSCNNTATSRLTTRWECNLPKQQARRQTVYKIVVFYIFIIINHRISSDGVMKPTVTLAYCQTQRNDEINKKKNCSTYPC